MYLEKLMTIMKTNEASHSASVTIAANASQCLQAFLSDKIVSAVHRLITEPKVVPWTKLAKSQYFELASPLFS